MPLDYPNGGQDVIDLVSSPLSSSAYTSTSITQFPRDSVEYTLKHFQDIPITVMFDLLHFEDEASVGLYQDMAKMNYDLGLFVDYTTKRKFEEHIGIRISLWT